LIEPNSIYPERHFCVFHESDGAVGNGSTLCEVRILSCL
jgi:hypothetical protein